MICFNNTSGFRALKHLLKKVIFFSIEQAILTMFAKLKYNADKQEYPVF